MDVADPQNDEVLKIMIGASSCRSRDPSSFPYYLSRSGPRAGRSMRIALARAPRLSNRFAGSHLPNCEQLSLRRPSFPLCYRMYFEIKEEQVEAEATWREDRKVKSLRQWVTDVRHG